MAEYSLAGRLYYVRYGVAATWYDVYDRPDPRTRPVGRLEPGQVFTYIEDRVQGPLRWYHVHGNQMNGSAPGQPFRGYVKEPADGTINALERVPTREYEGVPSLLAMDDIIALADDHPDQAEAVYKMVPNAESDPPTAGVVGPRDLARITRGPHRTAGTGRHRLSSHLRGRRARRHEALLRGAGYRAGER